MQDGQEEERKGISQSDRERVEYMLSRRDRLEAAEEVDLVQQLANMSFADAKRCKDNILEKLSIEMPLTFQ